MRSWLGVMGWCVAASLGCSSALEADGPEKEPLVWIGAAGVGIDQIAIYQGPKRVLAQGGQALLSDIPLVQGRNALLRVFVTVPPERVGSVVTGRLTIVGQESPIEVTAQLAPAGNDADLNSTINFPVDGSMIGESFDYHVSILEQGKADDDNPAAHFGIHVNPVEGPRNTFRVILAPFQYNADGSGRLPDLSPERVEVFRQRFLQLYPVSNVEVSVREPTPWNYPIQPNGQGWQDVGYAVFGMRGKDGTAADVYYYGIFQPTDTLFQFCKQGCLLGVTLLNDKPAAEGDPKLRLALGVGYVERATDTAVHEIGHAHGRSHAKCGPGLDPKSIDPLFPYPDAGIGPWAWDIASGALVNPLTKTDMMGYCDDRWISDYNYRAMLARGQNVNLPLVERSPRQELELVGIDGQGHSTWTRESARVRPGGEAVELSVIEQGGRATSAVGYYYRYDHLEGGWLLVPRRARAVTIEAVVDGRFVRARR